MREAIKKLFGASIVLMLLAACSFYNGSRIAAIKKPSEMNALAEQFASSPGDGWKLCGGFLMLIALAITFAGVMLITQERRTEG